MEKLIIPDNLPLTPEDYWEWNEKIEGGYGQPRPGVSPEEVEIELAAIPESIRYTYIFRKRIGSGSGES